MPSPIFLLAAGAPILVSLVAWRLALGRLAKVAPDGPFSEVIRRDGQILYFGKSMAFFAGGFRSVRDARLSRYVGLYWIFQAVGLSVLAVYVFLVLRAVGMI